MTSPTNYTDYITAEDCFLMWETARSLAKGRLRHCDPVSGYPRDTRVFHAFSETLILYVRMTPLCVRECKRCTDPPGRREFFTRVGGYRSKHSAVRAGLPLPLLPHPSGRPCCVFEAAPAHCHQFLRLLIMSRAIQNSHNRYSTPNCDSQIWRDWLRSERAANVNFVL